MLKHDYRIGWLSGVELDSTTGAISSITFRTDSGSKEGTRPLAAVTVNHLRSDEIHLHLVLALQRGLRRNWFAPPTQPVSFTRVV